MDAELAVLHAARAGHERYARENTYTLDRAVERLRQNRRIIDASADVMASLIQEIVDAAIPARIHWAEVARLNTLIDARELNATQEADR